MKTKINKKTKKIISNPPEPEPAGQESTADIKDAAAVDPIISCGVVKEQDPPPPLIPSPEPEGLAYGLLANLSRGLFDSIMKRKGWAKMSDDEFEQLKPKADYIEKKYLPSVVSKFSPELDFASCLVFMFFSRNISSSDESEKNPVVANKERPPHQRPPTVDDIQ